MLERIYYKVYLALHDIKFVELRNNVLIGYNGKDKKYEIYYKGLKPVYFDVGNTLSEVEFKLMIVNDSE